ncbi:MAG: cytochrome P450, partial [Hyphomicrobiaceae bacterium]|nr:cytochrome P450 [Hyphomicrobiaceae bacterium]
SIFVSNGAAWERHRRLMEPAFQQARIQDVFALMQDAAQALIARIDARMATVAPGQAAEIAIDDEMTQYAGDIIFRTIYSEPLNEADAIRIFSAFETFQRLAYAHGMVGLLGLPLAILPGRRRARDCAREIRSVLKSALDRRLDKLRRGDPVPNNDILASLLTTTDPVTGTRFDDGELLDQIAMLFLAGHETSAAALGWTLYLVANDPDIQTRIQAEVDSLDGADPLQFADLRELNTTRNTFREAMRLYPPVAFLTRDVERDDKVDETTMPAGSSVFISLWLLHRHTAIWTKPHCFDPDRFATVDEREAIRCAYLPFSAGPRVCVGAAFAMQEATLVLAELFRRYSFSPAPGHTPVPIARLTLRSDNGIKLQVQRRRNAPTSSTNGYRPSPL